MSQLLPGFNPKSELPGCPLGTRGQLPFCRAFRSKQSSKHYTLLQQGSSNCHSSGVSKLIEPWGQVRFTGLVHGSGTNPVPHKARMLHATCPLMRHATEPRAAQSTGSLGHRLHVASHLDQLRSHAICRMIPASTWAVQSAQTGPAMHSAHSTRGQHGVALHVVPCQPSPVHWASPRARIQSWSDARNACRTCPRQARSMGSARASTCPIRIRSHGSMCLI